MSLCQWLAASLAATGTVVSTVSPSFAADPTPVRAVIEFKSLRSASSDTAKARVEAWLRDVGQFDAKKFEAAWSQERSVEDRTVAAIAVALPEAAEAIATARKPGTPVPGAFPESLKNDKLSPFARSNVAAAYARILIQKRAYEDALEVSALVKPEELVDPAGFFFHQAVAQHATMKRDAAIASLTRLLDDVSGVPDRYVTVATLMFFDLQSWSRDEKNLANIGRMMDISSRRLDLARTDATTTQVQKKIVYRLDELIKQMENQEKPRPPKKPQPPKPPREPGEEPEEPMPFPGEIGPPAPPMPGPGPIIPLPPKPGPGNIMPPNPLPGERPIGPPVPVPGPGQPGENCPPGGEVPAPGPKTPRPPGTPGEPGEPGEPGLQPPVNPMPKDPAEKPYVPGPGNNKGIVDEALLRHYRNVWGTLPADKRAEVISKYQRETPPKFRPMIEAYFRSLNRMNGY